MTSSKYLEAAITRISSTLVCNHENSDRHTSSSCRREEEGFCSSLLNTNNAVASRMSKYIDGMTMHNNEKADAISQDMSPWKCQHGENFTRRRSSFLSTGTESHGVLEAKVLSNAAKGSRSKQKEMEEDNESIATIDDISGLMMQMESESSDSHIS